MNEWVSEYTHSAKREIEWSQFQLKSVREESLREITKWFKHIIIIIICAINKQYWQLLSVSGHVKALSDSLINFKYMYVQQMFNKLNVFYTFRRADKQQARKTISNKTFSRKNKTNCISRCCDCFLPWCFAQFGC